MAILGIFKGWAGAVEEAEPTADLSAPIDQCRYAVLDTELTGLDHRKDSIISIGAVRMDGNRIEMGRTLYREVSPETALTSESVLVHGITPSDLIDKPSIGGALAELREFCAGCVIVGHFLALDIRFLNREFKRLFNQRIENPVVDTYRLYEWVRFHTDTARRHFGENGDRDLFAVAKKFHIPVAQAHNALMDAYITAQLFQRLLRSVEDFGVNTLKDLLKIGKP